MKLGIGDIREGCFPKAASCPWENTELGIRGGLVPALSKGASDQKKRNGMKREAVAEGESTWNC